MAVRRKSSPRQPVSWWIVARKTTQYVALLGFVVLFLLARRDATSGAVVNLPIRLDPLAVLAHLLASRTFLAGSSLAILTILLTLIAGRSWCGWLCPLGTLLDIFPLSRFRKRAEELPDNLRNIKYSLLLLLLAAALLGNLSLLIFDPLTILTRTFTISIWPPLDQIITQAQASLYQVPFLAAWVTAIDGFLRPGFLPYEPLFYRNSLIFGGIFLAVVGLNLLAPRFWCRYICPLGGMLGWISKFSLLRRQVGEDCKGCKICESACPTGTINPAKGYASDPGECTMCLDCLDACPRSSIVFTPKVALAEWNTYDPTRRQALVAFGAALIGVGLFRSDLSEKREAPHLLRPPGSHENNFLAECVRCAECVRACPTGALQPSIMEAGLVGLWTPILIPRSGYCDFSCNRCGLVCPVQAIPALKLDEKRQQVIGKAYIDEDRCIAWSDRRECIVCEEMCPVPTKAITLELDENQLPDGSLSIIQLPRVERELCIGCGICEYKCPVNGQAAIRVFVPESQVSVVTSG